jgi:hypothetical protein
MASMSGFGSLRSSMRSISGTHLVLDGRRHRERPHTRDVVVEDVILVDGAVDDPFGSLVYDQDLPLVDTRQRQSWVPLGGLAAGRASASAYVVLGGPSDGIDNGCDL